MEEKTPFVHSNGEWQQQCPMERLSTDDNDPDTNLIAFWWTTYDWKLAPSNTKSTANDFL